MTTFRLLGGASCVAIFLCAGAALGQGLPKLQERPIELRALASEDIYFAPSLSVLDGGFYVPEIGAGLKFRGIGDPRLNLSIEGSAALFQPASVQELWIGSRLGFVVDDISKIEIVGNGSVGLIGGTPSYRFGFGGEIPILPSTDLFVEGTAAGHFGFSPTDIGVRAGLHFYPGRFDTERIETDSINALSGPRGTLYAGPSLTAIPSASAVIPAIDAGFTFELNDTFDLGPRASFGWQIPAATYEIAAGGEAGFDLTPEVRAFLFGEAGTIGGTFMFNRVGAGGEFKVAPNFSLVGELSTRGAIGTFTEGGFKFGTRFRFQEPERQLIHVAR